MTKEKQRQSIHWFLNLAVQRRVISSLPNDKPLAEISRVPNHIFLPSSNDCKNIDAFFRFHIANVHVKHIKCLKPFKKSVPNFIDHRYVKEISQKSQFCVLDLLNKSENKMEKNYINSSAYPRKLHFAHWWQPTLCYSEKKVFGGDVQTNERAYSAQLAMLNGQSGHFRLPGVVQRPEGLHRIMNFLLVLLMLSC